jgi:hypothetical protein
VVLWPKGMPATLLVILVATALPYTLKPLHAHREGHKYVGLWLADHMTEKEHLIDPLSWAEWYAGRTLYQPPQFRGKPEAVWVVVEKGKGSPHSRLPQWQHAVAVTYGKTPAYRWPEDAPPDGPAVEVYKLTHEEVYPAAAPPQPRPKRNRAGQPNR